MATATEVIREARTWIDTPFVHQGRAKGKDRGADCAGLIIGVAQALKISDFDFRAYGRQPVPSQMREILDQNLIKVPEGEMRPGDILWFKVVRPRHVAIYTERNTIIHIYDRVGSSRGKPVGRCVEHILDDGWKKKIIAVYRYPGMTDG